MDSTWDVINAAAAVTTTLIALLVYAEARRIRHTEWLTRSVQMWQGFNELLLTNDRAARWRAFLRGEIAEADFQPADHYVLYAYLNVIYSEYRYAKRGLLDRQYALEGLRDNVRQVATAGSYVIPKLRETGYDNEFIDLIEAVAAGRELRLPGRFDAIRSALRRDRPRAARSAPGTVQAGSSTSGRR